MGEIKLEIDFEKFISSEFSYDFYENIFLKAVNIHFSGICVFECYLIDFI